MKRKFGEVREDGFIFRGYQKGAHGRLEQWVSPTVFEKRKQASRAWRMMRMATDPQYRAKENARAAATQRAARRKDPKRFMLVRAKARAAAVGVAFNLTVDDFDLPSKCPVFGKRLRVADGKPDDWSPELDRIIPRRGYVVGNVIVVSRRANKMKQDATVAELQRLATFYNGLTQAKPMLRPKRAA